MDIGFGSCGLFLPPRPLLRIRGRRTPESDPLFRAVLANDLQELKNLVQNGNSVNIQNNKGNSLLNFVIRRNRVEIFDYLLSLESVDVNFMDRSGQPPLIYLIGVCFDEYIALELIKRGANINATDESGFNFLHLGAQSPQDESIAVGKIIIEKGCDINQQAQFGVTPLYIACESGNVNWICMLLYFGVDVFIPNDRNVLPLVIISQDLDEETQCFLQEILFNSTFNNSEKIPIRLPNLAAAMALESNLFLKIIEHTSEVIYDKVDLQYFVSSLINVKTRHLKVFFEKYPLIIKDVLENFYPLDVLVEVSIIHEIRGVSDIIETFLYSSFIADFVQASDKKNPVIKKLLISYLEGAVDEFDQNYFINIICLMLSYGLHLTSLDLEAVFTCFGFCDFFEYLLHMDFLLLYQNKLHASALFYQPHIITIDSFENFDQSLVFLLDYYSNWKLKEIVLKNCSDDDNVLRKVKSLPTVPLLVALSRNAARTFIAQKFNVKSCAQFYTILQHLPIDPMSKNIIALKQKLY